MGGGNASKKLEKISVPECQPVYELEIPRI